MLGRLLNSDEQRAISYQALWGSGGDVVTTTKSGAVMNQDTALRLGTVYACVRLYADVVSTLPADVYFRTNGERRLLRPKPLWVDFPEPGVTRETYLSQVLVSLLIDGNAFVRIGRDAAGEVVTLSVLDPRRIEVRRNRATREIEYLVRDTAVVLGRSDVMHIVDLLKPGAIRGTSRVEEVREELGLAAALDEFASRFFGQGSTTTGVIEYPGPLTYEQAQELAKSFDLAHAGLRKSHRMGVLYGGAKFNKTGVNPDEAQMLESRRFAVESICRVFRVPPHMVGVTTPGAMSYASVEQNGIQFVTLSVAPLVAKIEAAHSALLFGRDTFYKMNVNGLMRGDMTSRFTAYAQAANVGWLSINDIHRLEDMPPVDGGDVYRVPLANIDLNAANIAELDRKTLMAQRLVTVGFEPESVLRALGLPEIEHSGLPTTMLQPVAQINPADPLAAYQSSSEDESNDDDSPDDTEDSADD